MDEEKVAAFLEHYGRKGMKWGVRKAKGPKVGSSKDAKKAASSLAKSKSSGVRALSNKELGDLNKRLEMETKYRQLNPTVAKRGKDFVTQTVALGGTLTAAYAFAKSPIGQGIAKKLSRTA